MIGFIDFIKPVEFIGEKRIPIFTPASLFAEGQPGHWSDGYDPVLGRLWQDSTGVTPVTDPGQPVGLVSRAAGTADASQATALSRPTLARWPKGGRRNLMSISEPTVATVTVGGSSGIVDAAGFGQFSHSINFPIVGTALFAYVRPDAVSGTEVTFSAFVVMDDGLPPTFGSSTTTDAANDFSLRIGNNTGGGPLNYVVAHMGGGIYRVSVNATLGASLNNTGITKVASNSDRGFRATGYQLEAGNTLTPYQRVTTQYDITEDDVPDVWHLYDDGGDSLPVTLPAGTYGRAWVDADGLVTVDTVVDPADALVSNQQADIILRQGAFTAEEEANIRTYWARYAA